MSEDHAAFSLPPASPLRQAHEALRQRGQDLPVAALRLLAREVILRVSHAVTANSDHANLPRRSEINLLCDALLSRDDTAAADLVRAARQGGMSAQSLYHHYIAAAVREMGERWERDEASSAQVILGAGRVYVILRELRAVFLSEHLVAPPGAEAVMASVPGEVHGLGVTMAADALRMRGWSVTLRVGLGHQALVEEIAALHPTMVGLSVSDQAHLLSTARLIVALRVRCPQVWIILGGPLVAQDPDVARIVDADAGAVDLEVGYRLMAAHLDELNRLQSARA